MLDLDSHIIGNRGEFPMERFHNRDGMKRSIEEVWIAKGNVRSAHLNLLANISNDNVPLHHSEPSTIDRWNGAVTAKVLAATRGLCIADDATLTRRHLQLRIAFEERES